ncbi:phosphate ABC transporter permease subunit PstC [Catellatospora coxensis]|uniref:Phosphate transport system permease protein n=1 Tax=Catellatospora coxensis TaxID=310354 RepID=A0A8J3KV64_9ACTN|nr:phosphate ABC transporter permease subunit PstC [Catellatospora coxensis]GIG03771.1 phosphate transport system permease protein [Catellatospora coxensis]
MTSTSQKVAGIPAAPSVRRGRPRLGEKAIEALLVLAAIVSVATTVGIVISLAVPTVEFFGTVSLGEFVTETLWTPLFAEKHYGVLPLLVATLIVTAIAVTIAIPVGLGSAIYLSEYAGNRTRAFLKPILEILAGIPTVVYGFFALLAVNPWLRDIWPSQTKPEFQNMLVAGIAMGLMIVPTVASLAEDAMTAVPRSLREGAYALASTKMQVSTRVVLPAALSGIVAAIVLGISRALGETMIVTIAAGLKTDGIIVNPIDGAATMTAYIAGAGQGDLPVDSLDYLTIFAVGSTLFLFTLALNALSIRMVRRFREVYE